MNAKPKEDQRETSHRVGRGLELSHLHIVALYDTETGQVVLRHTAVVIKGGASISEEEAVKVAFDKAKMHYKTMKSDKKNKEANVRYLPIEKMKAIVSNDIRHLHVPFRVDTKSGKIVEIEEI